VVARIPVLVCIFVFFALPSFGKTYKSTYPIACGELWPAVQNTLSNPDNNYEVKVQDDGRMHAEYDVKHAAHVTITGVFTQRTNKVTLVPKGAVCEMQVVSNYSGWEHSDRGDFKERVDEALLKLKGASSAQPAKSATE
jgi:hypothetical protein